MKEQILHELNKKEFVSGEKLAKNLNVSRTAIWKQIKSLKQLGYEIETLKNKGYRLISSPDKPIQSEIKQNLKTKIIGTRIEYKKSVFSTNLIAKDYATKKISEGTVVVAEKQTKGRGRKQRQWHSPEGGLWFSVVLYPNLTPGDGILVTMAASVSVADAIQKSTGLIPEIKWPNDVLINGKKVCGILTEFDAEMDRINYVVVGVGINVNNDISKDISKIAVSLKQLTSSKVSRVNLLKSILTKFDEMYNYILSGNFKYVRDSWSTFANIIGKKIKVTGERNDIEGYVTDVDEHGCIIVETPEKKIRVLSGDVTYL
ncbi:MAG: biotin--[acetyl-CoA-carboxylase] ligase [Candidatus Thermoplasmatota archaeon]|nr:biotin--[acetyl-CoA-carboxylase] ligase [Candidatus Thermoplasmatota archaeon]